MDPAETRTLRLEVERSLRGAFDPTDVLPRLARLARLAAPSSDDAVFANHKLAELLVERDPWRAALYVRRALAHRGDDDRLWAILAFCQTLLGNFKCAATAYKKAIACAPSNPWYAHNLGHLLDVALGQPVRALTWLERAHKAKSGNSEIVASYAHALARAGFLAQARTLLEGARGRVDSRELDALMRWLDQGAPATRERARRPRPHVDLLEADLDFDLDELEAEPTAGTSPTKLAQVLARGLLHLPLDSRQRERALVLAQDALHPPAAQAGSVAGLAAAVAYAIVFIDHVPLSQAEVAAPFRVGVAHLRGRFAELRAKLDIIRGDARYATTRR
jgi:tetratricopeptide (TPR) repeat protein